MKPLPSIEEFAEKTNNSVRRIVKQALLNLMPAGRLAKTRRGLLLNQGSLCPLCKDEKNPLLDDGSRTHVDHLWTRQEAADAVLDGSMDLIEAYGELWAPENLRAVHAGCNYGRPRGKS